MKSIKMTAMAALLATSFIGTPASAAKPPLGPPTTDGLTPQEVCDLQLTPAEQSDFETYPINEVDGTWVNDGPPIQGDAVGDPEGYGTPTSSSVFLSNSYFRNGGSPNVWALAQATLTYPQTRQLFAFTQHQTTSSSFDCYVFKIVGHDTVVDPAGLQSVGNSTVDERTIDLPDDYVISDDDFIVEGATVHALICISPNNVTKGKPGTWTGKNGFLASNCPAASTAAGGTVPSDNAPNI